MGTAHRSTGPDPHPSRAARRGLRLTLGMAALAAGWLLVLADSAGPSYVREPGQASGQLTISLDLGYDYDCYPTVSLDPPAYRLALSDDQGTLLAEATCLLPSDCLQTISLSGWYYQCTRLEDGSSDAATDLPEGQSIALCSGDAGTDGDAGSDASTDADPSAYRLFWLDPWSQPACDQASGTQSAFVLTATTAAGQTTTLGYTQTIREPEGYGCF